MTVQTSSAKQDAIPSDDTLIQGFMEDCRLRAMSSGSITSYISILRTISWFLRSESLSFIELDKSTFKVVLKYLRDNRGFSHKTLANYFSALSTFYDYLAYEGIVDSNFVLPFRKRYLGQYKNATRGNPDPERRLISVEEMAKLVNSILDPRDRAIVTLLAKTGIRRDELINIDIENVDWIEQSIRLKPHPKRSSLMVFFDDECATVLKRWVNARKGYATESVCKALFMNERGGRLERNGVYNLVTKHAQRLGLHNPKSEKMEDHFTPHCCRHWFTTHLRRNGIRRELLQELRGDARNEAVDIYDHIDRKELKRAYLAAIPVLGIG